MKKFLLVTAMVMAVQILSLNVLADEVEPPKEVLDDITAIEQDGAKKIENIEKDLDEAAAKLERALDGSDSSSGEVDANLEAYFDHKVRMEKAKHPDLESVFVPSTMFGMTAAIVFFSLYFRNKKRASEAVVQNKAIEAGLQFIPELPAQPPIVRNDKRTGLILGALGVAGSVPIALYGYPREAVFGLALVFLGGAYFLAGKYLATDKE